MNLYDMALRVADFPEPANNDQILEKVIPILKQVYEQGFQDGKKMVNVGMKASMGGRI